MLSTTPRYAPRLIAYLMLGFLFACLVPAFSYAQSAAGNVEFTQGLATAQNRDAAPRFLNKGEALFEGDVINIGARGFAVIALSDGTKMTLRPNTTFAIDKFSMTTGQESAFFRLLKGGLRAITGSIAKSNPQAARVSTATSMIDIRGTSFDTRICDVDCARELRSSAQIKAETQPEVVARVVLHQGNNVVIGANGQSRAITYGTALFNGDTVRTEKEAFAVLAFRDQTKVTVTADSEFKLENVIFKGAVADSGSFVVRLLRGGARALTGLLAKRDSSAVKFNISTAVIGIRGTGVDQRLALDCVAPGNCAPGVFIYTWEGAVSLDADQQSLVVPAGRAGVYTAARNRLELLDLIPSFFTEETAPRPDSVHADFENLFGAVNIDGAPAGVYVNVRDGHINFAGRGGAIDLASGEAGFLADGQDIPVRLTRVPRFLAEDPIPAPENLDESTLRLLEVLNPGGNPGDVICEI